MEYNPNFSMDAITLKAKAKFLADNELTGKAHDLKQHKQLKNENCFLVRICDRQFIYINGTIKYTVFLS